MKKTFKKQSSLNGELSDKIGSRTMNNEGKISRYISHFMNGFLSILTFGFYPANDPKKYDDVRVGKQKMLPCYRSQSIAQSIQSDWGFVMRDIAKGVMRASQANPIVKSQFEQEKNSVEVQTRIQRVSQRTAELKKRIVMMQNNAHSRQRK